MKVEIIIISTRNFFAKMWTADVGKSTVCGIQKKSAQVGKGIDKSATKVVCIDVFATNRHHTYGTVMVDA